MTRLLVVTGDDFGASPEVNQAIARAHGEGVLTTASVLVSGEAFDEAAQRARDLPNLSTGLHLALCDAAPASPPDAIPDLVGPDGRFPPRPGPTGVSHFVHWSRRKDQLEREVRAQVERYLAAGLSLDHVDSHHHLHMHPRIFDLVQRFLEDYKVPWVRLVDEDRGARRGGEPWLGEIVAGAFRLLSARARRALAAGDSVRGPDRVYGLRATGRMDRDEWLRLLPRMGGEVAEVYAHPSTASAPGRRELEALCDDAVRQAIRRAGWRTLGTRELAHAEARSVS